MVKLQILKIVGMLVSIFLIGMELASALQFKYATGIEQMELFYQEKANSIDVICIGSSQMFCNINPKTLWEDFGIASYDLGGAAQPFWNSFFYMKEALKSQTPRLFILDVLAATLDSEYSPHSNIIKNTFGLSFSENRFEAIKASAPASQELPYYLSYPCYHQRYANLSKSDFSNNYTTFKGHLLLTSTKSFPNISSTNIPVSKETMVNEKERSYLIDIINFCKEHEVPLLLIRSPNINYMGEEINLAEVDKIAKEYDIPFVNFNHYADQIGIDFTSDMADNSHLNYRGSAKFSHYLGTYLKQHYNLPDHRGDVEYSSYDTMCHIFQGIINNQELVDEKNFSAFIALLNKNIDRYVIVVNLQGTKQASLRILKNPAFEKLRKIGIPIEAAKNNAVWVVDSGCELFHAEKAHDVNWHTCLGDNSYIYIYRSSPNNTIQCNICRETEQFLPNGLSIIVYDKEMERVIERAGFSTDEKGEFQEKSTLKCKLE